MTTDMSEEEKENIKQCILEYGYLSYDQLVETIGEIIGDFPDDKLVDEWIKEISHELAIRRTEDRGVELIGPKNKTLLSLVDNFQKGDKNSIVTILRGFVYIDHNIKIDFSLLHDKLNIINDALNHVDSRFQSIFGEIKNVVVNQSLLGFSLVKSKIITTITINPYSFTITSIWEPEDFNMFRDPRYGYLPSIEFNELLKIPTIAEAFKGFELLKNVISEAYGVNHNIYVTEIEHPIH